MESIKNFIRNVFAGLSLPSVKITDIIDIIILAVVIYNIIKWIKTTRAWSLLKGLGVIMAFWILAIIFELNAVQWIITNTLSVGIIAVIVIFQPEFRKALEQLGQRNIVKSFISFEDSKEKGEKFSNHTLEELVNATFDLSRNKVGALMVIENETLLNDFIDTGIFIDSLISRQLIINIFEPNTPLHDGAVIIRDDRMIAATCYLPLSDNMYLSKELGTRHRAGIGISEITDSVTIIVSEETGRVSIASNGKIVRNINSDYLRTKLEEMQKKHTEPNRLKLWKGRIRGERKDN